VPSAQVELDDGNEALEGVIDRGHGKKGLRMSHEVGDPFQHGARLQNEGRQYDSAQVCARSELGNDMRQHIALFRLNDLIFPASAFWLWFIHGGTST
jgi:hypothetical protein